MSVAGWLLSVIVLFFGITFVCHTLPTINVIGVHVEPAAEAMSVLRERGETFDAERLQRFGFGKLSGPESFVVDPDDEKYYYAGTADGKIVRVGQDNSVSVVSHIGGRPLGIHAISSNHTQLKDIKIIVAEALKGLLAIYKDGTIRILANYANNRSIQYANDLDIDEENAIIYFTDCSMIPPSYDKKQRVWSTMKTALFDILSGYPSGRLLKYTFETNTVEELLSDVAYANGVALSKDKSFVLVAETGRYCIRRYWLEGPSAGKWDYFIQGLPMLPDGVSRSQDGRYWVSGFYRSPVIDWAHQFPTVKKVLMKTLLDLVFQVKKPYGIVLQLSESGSILRSIHDEQGTLLPDISSVSCVPPYLLIGGLERNFLAVYEQDP